MYEGEKVVFYSMGLNLGVHIFGAQGHTWEVKKKRLVTHDKLKRHKTENSPYKL